MGVTASGSGRLPAGSLLPSSRLLAAEMGVSRNTVVIAYEHLAAVGYVVADKKGTRVSPLSSPSARGEPRTPSAAPEVAFTAKLLSAAVPVMVAESVSPDVWIRCCSKALFETCDRPTATPTPTPADPEALDPSAMTLEELPVVLVRLVAPVTTAFTDDAICASVFDVTSAMESAPAALMAPSLVDS